MPASRKETHSLVLKRNRLCMGGTGIDKITKVYCILCWGPLQEWNKKSPEFLDMPFDAHLDRPEHLVKGLSHLRTHSFALLHSQPPPP
jgi:hypothetical protein